MGGIALLARELGYTVSGSDANVYPPMSTQLENAGITLSNLDDTAQFTPVPDLVVIGNALSRGKPAVEWVLNNNLPYASGPEFLASHLLKDRWVLAVSGTHGKTTTSSMLAWILEDAGLKPGFLIGGIPENFGMSARSGDAPFFVVEADEYDTAFFDKRSKFVHYRPLVAILNNLEYDHADIFPDVAAIQRQFHHLVRTVPRRGRLVVNGEDRHLAEVLAMGCWTPVETFGLDAGLAQPPADHERPAGQAVAAAAAFNWTARLLADDGSAFVVVHDGIDIAAALGTPVQAIAAGRVTIAGRMGDGAVVVEIEHAPGVFSRYGHLQPDLRVRVGQSLGRIRVARISEKSITFTIEEFGFSRQETLLLGDPNKEKPK